jgi:type I restriction enzyme S subunit
MRNVFRERGEVSEDGTEELLSVSKYTGVKVRSTTTDREARAASLVGYKKCEPNDIVSNIMLAWDSALGVAFDSGIVSSAYEVYVPQQEIDPHFLDLLLRTPEYRVAFTIVSKGIVPSRWRMYTESFNDIQMILPPLNEQKQIGSFVHRINENILRNIETLETQISVLEEKRSVLITQAVTKGLNSDVKMKDSGNKWIGKIPAHWNISRLKYHANIKARIGFRGYTVSDLVEPDEGALTLGATHISSSGEIDLSSPVYISWEKYFESPEIMVSEGDILIVQRGSCGKIGYVSNDLGPATINPSLAILKNTTFDSGFMNYLLNSDGIEKLLDSIQGTTAVPMISQEQIGEIPICIPPSDEIESILDFLNSKTLQLKETESMLKQEINQLNEYRIALISAAVTGKIDVRNRTTPAETSSTDSHPQTARVSGTDRLNQLRKPPKQVYQKGTLLDELDLTRSVAIVGSRGVSDEGLAAARALGKSTAEAGHIVVSGLANGIDTAAFEGALEGGGMCVIVLPSGVDIITPRGNKDLAQRILDAGGTIVSEQPNGTNARKFMFIERNRMIAALSDTVVLGEARENGGAWHTVKAAWALKKSTLKLHNDGSTTPLVNPQRELM